MGVAAETDPPPRDVIAESDVVPGGDGAALADETFDEGVGEQGRDLGVPAGDPGADDGGNLDAGCGAAVNFEVALEGFGEAGGEDEGLGRKIAGGQGVWHGGNDRPPLRKCGSRQRRVVLRPGSAERRMNAPPRKSAGGAAHKLASIGTVRV